MAHGIIIFDDSGRKILDSSMSVARLVGWHDIDPPPVGSFKYSWNHSNLLQYGELFAWVNPNFRFNHNGYANVNINNGILVFEGNLSRFDNNEIADTFMRILYGVKS